MSWLTLKKADGPRDLEVSIAGLKLGSRVLQVDGDDPDLIAVLAKQIGLSGRAAAVARTATATRAFERAAEKAGVLVESTQSALSTLPFDDNVFDLVVLKNLLAEVYQNERVLCLQQAYRVLRVGGRCLVIDRGMRGGLGAAFSKRSMDPHYLRRGGANAALEAEGFRGVRLLADRDGLVFSEGIKPQPSEPSP